MRTLFLLILLQSCGGYGNLLKESLTHCKDSNLIGIYTGNGYILSANRSCGIKIADTLNNCIVTGMFADTKKNKAYLTVKHATNECNLLIPHSYSLEYKINESTIDFILN